MFAVNLITFVPVLYATTYLGANQEEYGTKLIFGGVVQGVALVLLIWMYFYTEYHDVDEAAMKHAFLKLAENLTTGQMDAEPVVDSSTVGSPVGEESEF
jgi:ABC-type molybdate transport system permease subunit